MGFSKYPRHGQRIAPAILRDILQTKIPSGILPKSAEKYKCLADLDDSIWQIASKETCTLLADLVVKELHSNINRLSLIIQFTTLHVDVPKIPLSALDLQVRTSNALKNRFGDDVPINTRICDLLNIANLGARSIVDFLVSVESFSARPQQTQQLELLGQIQSASAALPEDLPSKINVEISHYPRPGNPIAPKTLKMLLCVPSGDQRLGQLQLCDLDESTWNRLSAKNCHRLADAVIERVKVFRNELRKEMGWIKLPVPQTKGKPIILQLEKRTFNCLQERGLLDEPYRLAQMNVADLLTMPAFGVKSVVDLLSSLESQMPELFSQTPKVITVTQKLFRIKDARAIRVDDLRFGLALQALRVCGETLQEICEAIFTGIPCPMNAELFASRIKDLFSNIQAARQMTLEDELLDLLAFDPNPRNRDLTIRFRG